MPLPGQSLKLRNAEHEQQSRVQDNISAVLTPIATNLGVTPIMGAAPPPWVRLDVFGGFATMGTAGVNPNPEHHVDALRYVHFRGRVSNPTGGALVGVSMCRLPAGARPNVYLFFYAIYSLAAATSVLVIQPDGYVLGEAAAGENFSWCITFLAEQ